MSRITLKSLFVVTVLSAVQLSAASTFYVSTEGSHIPPYNTIDKAATNIQSAVNVATNAGDKVLILDGTNFLVSAVAISQAIIVEGANGPDSAIVNGSGITHCFELGDVSCIISGLTITNGYNSGDGGGIICDGTAPVITNCVIAGNYAGGDGGGIFGGTVIRSVIRNNIAEGSGGGVSGTASPALIYDSLILDNSVSNGFGGGVLLCDIYNCTVVGNDAQDGGGADQCNVYNSIIVSNTVSVFSGVNIGLLGDILSNTCSSASDDFVDGLDGNITADPLFVDFSAGNYRLQSGSPCINAGNNSYVINAVDLDGNPRIVGVVDMGAYEEQSGAGDTDNDGMSDADEAIAGTDPNDDTSYFAITNWSPGSFTIEWPAFTNREYQVYRADSLTNTFDPVGPVIYFPQNSYTDSVPGVGGFYKVEVQLQ